MSPALRKAASDAKLRALGVPINESLPPIETEEETTLRSSDDLVCRLIALWAVVGRAFLGPESRFASYIRDQGAESWLSEQERAYLFAQEPSQRDSIHFSWQVEAFFFLAWCAGLLEAPEVPSGESSVEPILDLFPTGKESPTRLRGAIRVRGKAEILDRADLLYRLHWAVRNAQVTGSAPPTGVNGGMVQEWHRAVNWMIRYEGEDSWDHVGTDT